MRTGRSLTVCCSVLPGGVPGLGGCLFQGGLLWGEGVPGPAGGVSQHALRQTPLPPPSVDKHTLVKTLPWPNFVAVGKDWGRDRGQNNVGQQSQDQV